ncbi:hypothetical protein [Mycobacterium sp. HUMS_1102779]|uniref:hypothetical protein n=1 Tax=Mycobacterium sp. HUMS_1102779 TaxID=3383487 RepID=UPI003899B54F
MKRAKVLQTRPLRDGHQFVELTCDWCGRSHWYMDPGHLVYCLDLANRPSEVVGLGSPVR